MAIHPSLQPHIANQSSLTPQQALTISTWTEQATTALQNLDISALASKPTVSASDPTVQGASVPLTIPLDEPPQKRDTVTASRARVMGNGLGVRVQSNLPSDATRREISRRDSLKRREALLKGKEGSRRRQRWENGMSWGALGCYYFDALGS
jgi:R3H-associated N-terminal domain